MRKSSVLIIAGCYACVSAFGAIDLKESKFTQVVNEVQIISTSDNSKHPASVDGVFKMPDVLRTGPASRAELVAADNTITRVGANTIFSFNAANRAIDLQQGSLLFNSPKGKGGGSIHTAAATAAVLGTTIIVTTTADGGFKVITLEGEAEVKFLSGLNQHVRAGQLIFVLPGGVPGPVLNFRLDQLVAGSRLVSGFGKPLPSLGRIKTQIAHQIKEIRSGRAQDTGLLAGNQATANTISVINPITAIDANPGASTSPEPEMATSSGSSSNAPPSGIPTSPPGTIVASGGGYLNPDGFVFTSFTTNASGGAGPGPTYASLVATATLSDATINSPTLDNNPNMPGSRVFTSDIQVTIPLASDFNGVAAAGYYARNITVNTPAIDFSPYSDSGFEDFVFFASENLTIQSSVTLSAFPTELGFFAGDTLSISPGVSIQGNSTELFFEARNAMNFSSVSLNNLGGDLDVISFSGITLSECTLNASSEAGTASVIIANGGGFAGSGDITLNSTTIQANLVDIESSGNLTLSAATPGAGQITGSSDIFLSASTGLTSGVNLSSDAANGSIELNNAAGLLTVNNGAALTANSITIDSPSILVDSLAPVIATTLTLTGGTGATDMATVQNTDLNAINTLSISARTVVLNNVSMSGTVFLNSATGLLAANPNTDAAVIPGDINFIQNVNYNGAPAQNAIGHGINLGTTP